LEKYASLKWWTDDKESLSYHKNHVIESKNDEVVSVVELKIEKLKDDDINLKDS